MPRRPSRSREHTASALASIRRLVRLLRLAAQQTQTSAGITAAQLFVLQQLGDDAALSLSELADRTLTDRTSVAAIVDRLAARRLVDRAVDPDDRRRAVVRLTAGGRRVLQRAPSAPATGLLAALHELSPRDLAKLASSLDQLIAALGAANEPATFLFADESAPRRRPARKPSSMRARRTR